MNRYADLRHGAKRELKAASPVPQASQTAKWMTMASYGQLKFNLGSLTVWHVIG